MKKIIIYLFVAFISFSSFSQTDNDWTNDPFSEWIGLKTEISGSLSISFRLAPKYNICKGMAYSFYRMESTFDEVVWVKVAWDYTDCDGKITEYKDEFHFDAAGIKEDKGYHFFGYRETGVQNIRIISIRFLDREKAEAEKKKADAEAKKKAEEEKEKTAAAEKEKEKQQKQQVEQQQKEKSAREAEQKRLAQAERRRIEEENNRKFEQRKSQAISDQRARDESNNNTNAQMTTLMLAWVGFYMFDEPLNRYYNKRGMFFTFGPTTSFLFAPTYTNVSLLKTYNKNEYKYGMINDYSSDVGVNFTIPLGLSTSFGYMSDMVHLTVPLSASFGYIAHNSSYKYSAGTNLFLGLRNWEHIKIGVGMEYNYSNLSKSYSNVDNSYSDYFSEYYDRSDADFAIKSMKLGVRFQNNLSTLNINTREPFVVDLYFTMNHVKELNQYLTDNLNKYVHPMAPGFEVHLNKYGIFGFYGKMAFIRPTGKLENYQTTNTTEDVYDFYYAEWHQVKIDATTFKLGDKFFPYLEFGIKRDYSWFKKH